MYNINTKENSRVLTLNPIVIINNLWAHRRLIIKLSIHEISNKYKGTFGGILLAFVNPLLMLGVYTFVFSCIFKSKWGTSADDSTPAFAITLFLGLITFMVIAEVLNASPSLIVRKKNYVKKVVFPTEILPVVTLLSSLTSAVFSLVPLFVTILIMNHKIPFTAVLLPLTWIPLIVLSLGCSYFLASLGVFIRDLSSVVQVFTTLLRFISPIFYPISAIPVKIKPFILANPLSTVVEDARRVVLYGKMPEWPMLCMALIISLAIFFGGYLWFMKTKKAFADVI